MIHTVPMTRFILYFKRFFVFLEYLYPSFFGENVQNQHCFDENLNRYSPEIINTMFYRDHCVCHTMMFAYCVSQRDFSALLMDATSQTSFSSSSPTFLPLPRLFDFGSRPAVPDHPWPRSDLHPPTAAGRMDHRAALHHPGHHLPYSHLRSCCDVTLAPRGQQICPMDRLHREYVSTATICTQSKNALK